MGNNISNEINYIVTWAMAMALMECDNTQPKIMVMQNVNIDCCLATVLLNCMMSSERSEISNAKCESFTKLNLINMRK
jgi:hypothetical protein